MPSCHTVFVIQHPDQKNHISHWACRITRLCSGVTMMICTCSIRAWVCLDNALLLLMLKCITILTHRGCLGGMTCPHLFANDVESETWKCELTLVVIICMIMIIVISFSLFDMKLLFIVFPGGLVLPNCHESCIFAIAIYIKDIKGLYTFCIIVSSLYCCLYSIY